MRIRVRAANFAGQPLPGTGPVLTGTAVEVVQAMQRESPFTAAMTLQEFCASVLRRVAKDAGPPLPADEARAAQVFLIRLAALGWIEVLE